LLLLCYLLWCKNTKSLLSIIYYLLWIHVGINSYYQWHQGMSKMSVHHKTYFSQPRNDWLCIFSNYCAFLKTTGLSLCTSRIIMIYELFLLQLLSRHIICVAGIKSINVSLKMGVWQTRYQTYNVRHMLCCRESIKGILVKPGENEQTFCRIIH